MNYSLFKFTFFSLLFFATSITFSQVDGNNGNESGEKKKVVILNKAKEVKKPEVIDLNSENGFKKAFEKEQEKLKKQQDEDLSKKGILTQAKLNEERFLKSFKKINGQYIIPKIDQDLGSFRTSSQSVNIICRDYQYPDGDRVTIFVNDIPVIYNITLQESWQKFNIPLEVGINKIQILALNQGTSGPNTAAFKVFNDAGMLISSSEWNLATDAKATLIIAKDK
ncbi:hypothetical protein [Polaribacter gangjinensis]|uniref:Secreted protein n=1 Tax=Polaribacter gangjinensis TaxID=574710 RepID=A0A2S7W8H9_9FLAO|nr:hypothetical protein [Polaribacter gangjinensis]PQJ73919.1 hypothetical protein BTO13_00875 [Polaribacter gangjinensis]